MVDVLAGMSLEIVPPTGGRIYNVKIPVILDRDWQKAISVASNTPSGYNVRKVGSCYQPTGIGRIWANITLVNFGPSLGSGSSEDGFLEKAIEWARSYNLGLTSPRHVFAISEYRPKLDDELEMNLRYLVATTECCFGYRRVCVVCFNGAKRSADLPWIGDVGAHNDWFTFVSAK